MTCAACGQEQFDGAHFCVRCGARLVAAPVSYSAADFKAQEQRRRVHAHRQPLGIAWVMYGAYRLIAALAAGLALHHFVQVGDVPPFFVELAHTLLPVVETLIVTTAALALLTGYAVLTQKLWARPLAIVMSILALLKVPVGTGLGIYTLWVLAPRAAGVEWQRLAVPAVV